MRIRIEIFPHKKYIPPNSTVQKHKKPYQWLEEEERKALGEKEGRGRKSQIELSLSQI
jgi:hypothetical protein